MSVARPTRVRLSDHFLLSDFMGNHSVYSNGYANVFQDVGNAKLDEGVRLAETVFEHMVVETPLSISYGYISPALAEKIVTYQSPKKPSYHRWDDGAAADAIFHCPDSDDTPPIYIAKELDGRFPLSRLITYSESPYLCIATRAREIDAGRPRKAFYENRYMGKARAKPLYTTVPEDRETFFEKHQLAHPWRGAGYPTYHGGGRRQLHHIRVGQFCMLSDFLYSEEAVHKGFKNVPTPCAGNLEKARKVGAVYDALLVACQVNRLSIVRAYESPQWSPDTLRHWDGQFALDLVPPVGLHIDSLAHEALHVPGVHTVASSREEGRITVVGDL